MRSGKKKKRRSAREEYAFENAKINMPKVHGGHIYLAKENIQEYVNIA